MKPSKFRESAQDLWSFSGKPGTYVFITTNGTVKQSGDLIMGKGCAKEAKDKFPGISAVLGEVIRKHGNQVIYVKEFGLGIFPVKTQWYNRADLTLIRTSAQQLARIASEKNDKGEFAWKEIVLPRPGCGAGGLDWETQVRPALSEYFDERFIVVHKPVV